MRHFHNPHPTITEDRCCPAEQTGEPIRFVDTDANSLSVEQVAYALSQLTAAHILPSMLDLACGVDLLDYQVNLREAMSHTLLRELALVLAAHGAASGWVQISQYAYLSVIGAGVAARLDITPWQEKLDLRVEGQLANELFHAGRTLDLPRSRLFLQANLHQSLDRLLAQVRDRTWHWLAD